MTEKNAKNRFFYLSIYKIYKKSTKTWGILYYKKYIKSVEF